MRALSLLFALAVTVSGGARAQMGEAERQQGKPVIIFFAWDRPVVDGDAAAQLDKIVEAVREASGVRLELSGHADRSGPERSNLRAGLKRAEAVRAYLAARGVPEAAMALSSHGETRPLIATADGVREPQNRRVEIVTRQPALR